MVKPGLVVLLLVGLLGVALPLAAQTPARGLDSASVVMLKPDRFVRIQVPDLGRITGTVRWLRPADVMISRDGDHIVALAAIDTLWVRGRRTKAGAIIGGILGAGGGAFLGALGDALCEVDCEGDSVLPGALLGAGAGAIIGAVVGTAIPRWKRVFPH